MYVNVCINYLNVFLAAYISSYKINPIINSYIQSPFYIEHVTKI